MFYGLLSATRVASVTTRLFFFWMAFQGLFQSLTQVAIGTLIPGNDLGRALTYLGLSPTLKVLCLAIAVALMAITGRSLAARFPHPTAGSPSRALGALLYSGILAVPLIIPFRVPRSAIEVVLVPLIINLIGTGWLMLGASLLKARVQPPTGERPSVLVPALACCFILMVFQLVLRPGIRF